MTYYGGIEAGGTKFVCAIGTSPDDIPETTTFPTTGPEETLKQTVAFFRKHREQYGLRSIGIGSFGPLDLIPSSPTFGYITSTPKPGWSNTDFKGAVARALDLPVFIDTDVNAAALGEYRWGAARGLDTFIYLTIGTGVGGGGLVNGELMHGLVHPEMGHIPLRRDPEADPFRGICPYHGDCLEGLACGPALEQRWGTKAENLPAMHPAWKLEAHYLALALETFICMLSPQRIVMGGGVMNQPNLLPLVRQEVLDLLSGYIQSPTILDYIDEYIVPPGLGGQAGVLGSIALAERGLAGA
ncbi:MAG: ROK family protein [Gemmatimonadota bacterium]|nr:ROK family protein [Gemmatimonadota bacterium]